MADQAPRAGPLRTLLRWGVQLAVLALVLWFLADRVYRDLQQPQLARWNIRPGWLFPAGMAYAAGLLPCAWFWRRVLRQLGYPVPWLPLLRAYFWGHLGKYVPGKALVVVLRTAALRPEGVPARVAVVTVFYETLTMMAFGAAVAVVLLGWLEFHGTGTDSARGHRWLLGVGLGCGLLALVPTLPGVFRRLAGLLWPGEREGQLPPLEQLGWGTLLAGHLAMLLTWTMLSLSTLGVLKSLRPEVPWPVLWGHWPAAAAATSLAVVAGFLSLIPGGLAVREAVIVALLDPVLGSTGALVLAVLLRVVWLVSEAVVSIMLALGQWYLRRPGREPAR